MCQDYSAMKPGLCGAGVELRDLCIGAQPELCCGPVVSWLCTRPLCVTLYPFKDRSCYVISHNPQDLASLDYRPTLHLYLDQ